MSIRPDVWLAQRIGYPVFRLEKNDNDGAASSVTAELREHVSACSLRTMYYAKVDTCAIGLVRDLSALGLYVVDVNVTLRLEAGQSTNRCLFASDVEIEDCAAADAGDVLRIAGSAFHFSRFHLDPLVPDAVAHRIKRDWIENYVAGVRGEALMVARLNGQVVGFLAVLGGNVSGRAVKTIDLIAVDASARGRGVGVVLVRGFVDRYAPETALLQVGTQVANAPSLRLYQKLGFSVHHTAYVMHLHTPAGASA